MYVKSARRMRILIVFIVQPFLLISGGFEVVVAWRRPLAKLNI